MFRGVTCVTNGVGSCERNGPPNRMRSFSEQKIDLFFHSNEREGIDAFDAFETLTFANMERCHPQPSDTMPVG
jgi:hypothetical protein